MKVFLVIFFCLNAAGLSAQQNSGMVSIPRGTFRMGSHEVNEALREVTVSSFMMARSVVTEREFAGIMGRAGSASNLGLYSASLGSAERPAEATWFDAVEYCNRLSRREGLTEAYTIHGETVTLNAGASGYRLPTEAEWEYACRAGANTTFSGAGHPWGLVDIPGTLEWCWDWYAAYPNKPETNPTGAASGTNRLLRGGMDVYGMCGGRGFISVFRSHSPPSALGLGYTFRVVRGIINEQ